MRSRSGALALEAQRAIERAKVEAARRCEEQEREEPAEEQDESQDQAPNEAWLKKRIGFFMHVACHMQFSA